MTDKVRGAHGGRMGLGLLRLLILVLAVWSAGPTPAQAQAQAPGRPQVLVLNGWHVGLVVPDSTLKGIIGGLVGSGISPNDIFVEQLDLIRFTDLAHRADVARLIQRKIEGKSIAIIVGLGLPALDFMRAEGRDLAPGVPLVSTFIPPGTSMDGLGGRPLITVPWQVDIPGTLNAALALYPETTTVLVVCGARDDFLGIGARVRAEFANWDRRIKFEYTSDMTFDELLARAGSLPPGSIIYYTPYFVDRTGQRFIPVEVADRISRLASAPVFSIQTTFLDHGIVGGALMDAESVGGQAGKAAADFVGGRLVLDRPETIIRPTVRVMFDWPQLMRWKGDESRLPEDSILLNRPQTLWSQYRAVVIGTVLALAMMAVLSLALVAQNVRRRRAEQAARASEAELRRSNADLEQFAYVASHDLQTPLRTVVSFVQLLQRRYGGRMGAEADEYISFIVNAASHMSNLITDILDYSRVAVTGHTLVPVSAARACAAALAHLAPDIAACGADVRVADLPVVMGEESQLVAVFRNLMGNAVKYRDPGRPLAIQVSANRLPGGEWLVAVADNGIGIDPAYFEKIFEIFQRLHPDADRPGTGIGLTFCRRVVHRFGGRIWVESQPGQGTRFLFTLRDGQASFASSGPGPY